MKAIAFFDLDHTLVDGSTGLLIAKQLFREGVISPKEMVKGLWYTLLYKTNRLPYDEAIKWIYKVCGKITIDELVRATNIAYEEHILPCIFQEGIDTISSFREMGFLTCLATSSSDYIAEKVRAQVSAECVISNESVVKENHLTDELVRPICYGEGKKARAEELAKEQEINLSRCVFFSDSPTDLPLLASVGEPVIVNPARTSRWYTNLKHHRVVYWKTYVRNLHPIHINTPWT